MDIRSTDALPITMHLELYGGKKKVDKDAGLLEISRQLHEVSKWRTIDVSNSSPKAMHVKQTRTPM